MSAFNRLIDTLAAERDRRASARDAAMLVERVYHGGEPFRRAVAGLADELRVMAKAMTANLAESRATQRQTAADSLARINAKATELAASGQLTGEQGAILDGLLHLAAMRVEAL